MHILKEETCKCSLEVLHFIVALVLLSFFWFVSVYFNLEICLHYTVKPHKEYGHHVMVIIIYFSQIKWKFKRVSKNNLWNAYNSLTQVCFMNFIPYVSCSTATLQIRIYFLRVSNMFFSSVLFHCLPTDIALETSDAGLFDDVAKKVSFWLLFSVDPFGIHHTAKPCCKSCPLCFASLPPYVSFNLQFLKTSHSEIVKCLFSLPFTSLQTSGNFFSCQLLRSFVLQDLKHYRTCVSSLWFTVVFFKPGLKLQRIMKLFRQKSVE